MCLCRTQIFLKGMGIFGWSPLLEGNARRRSVYDKETGRWLTVIDDSAPLADEAGVSLWFLLDREGDGQGVLLKLMSTNHRFTVRSSCNRRLESSGKEPEYLYDGLKRSKLRGEYFLEVAAGPNREARSARMAVHWQRVTLRLQDERNSRLLRELPLHLVWTHEVGTCPPGEATLNWHLLTNGTVSTFEDARHVINGYTQRWRIEVMHKTWKSGACKVEQTQLRTKQAVRVWATILSSVAVRVERIKLLP